VAYPIVLYFEKYLNEQVTDQAVRNYYNTKASEYEQKKAHVAHILIRLNSKMSEEERKVKLTTAQEAYSKIRAGEDFAEIAAQYSEDKISAKKGGDLGCNIYIYIYIRVRVKLNTS
jgi:peptidyl-prolyl cis-trans isomerase C